MFEWKSTIPWSEIVTTTKIGKKWRLKWKGSSSHSSFFVRNFYLSFKVKCQTRINTTNNKKSFFLCSSLSSDLFRLVEHRRRKILSLFLSETRNCSKGIRLVRHTGGIKRTPSLREIKKNFLFIKNALEVITPKKASHFTATTPYLKFWEKHGGPRPMDFQPEYILSMFVNIVLGICRSNKNGRKKEIKNFVD